MLNREGGSLMRRAPCALPGLVLAAWSLVGFVPDAQAQTAARQNSLHVSPATVTLDNPEAAQQMLARSAAGDLTRVAAYEVLEPKIASVDETGMVRPRSEGRTILVVRHGQEQVRVPVEVSGLQ